MPRRISAPLALAVSLGASMTALLGAPPDAEACGGCFIPPEENTVVNAHRMALSISPTQTVLWDQIQYAGSPAEFAWVLPVKPGARIEVASDAWFETLEAATGVRVVPRPPNCGGGGGSFIGCGASDFASAGEARDGGGGVTVIHRGTVGPYETVTLSTDEPGALNDWLSDYGFGVDPSTQPIIDAYVAEGFDFIALRLQPGKDVKEMKPVRVTVPGASPGLPLRMIAAGAGENVRLTLFVISEGRWEIGNFPNVRVPTEVLSWDYLDSSSNYGLLRERTLERSGGLGWLTPYVHHGALLSPVMSQGLGSQVWYSTEGFNGSNTIAGAFVLQGLENDETTSSACMNQFPSYSGDERLVVDPCPAGALPDDPSCVEVAAHQLDARIFKCGELDDLGVALTGLHPSDVWLTRLEADLPVAALDRDLVLAPAKEQVNVDNYLVPTFPRNEAEFCGSAAVPARLFSGGSKPPPGGSGALFGLAAAALALGAAAARRARRVGNAAPVWGR